MDMPGGGTQRYVFSYSINSWTNFMHGDRGDRKEEWFWKNVNNTAAVNPNTGASMSTQVSRNNIPVFADATWHDAWPRHTDTPSPTMDAFGIGNKGGNEPLRNRPAQGFRELPVHGLVHARCGNQGTLDVEVASFVQHDGAVDKSRRRQIRGLARLDAALQGLLRRTFAKLKLGILLKRKNLVSRFFLCTKVTFNISENRETDFLK